MGLVWADWEDLASLLGSSGLHDTGGALEWLKAFWRLCLPAWALSMEGAGDFRFGLGAVKMYSRSVGQGSKNAVKLLLLFKSGRVVAAIAGAASTWDLRNPATARSANWLHNSVVLGRE